ncbi:MarR family winged helix-turn-helix transcriptional regulator [Cupriavidus pauculus]|uniref:MarR family winged helix-turn-helix transcriptional regulator n=1 Tax=Cupriavidus pauculus TaxID=82633 RepID=UPI001FD3E39A|nr:MarR family transcriptional regulator [Cupriavidus pauculus]
MTVALYAKAVGDEDITPVQFSALHLIFANPGIDQKTVALQIGYDVATVAGVLARLEARKLVHRAVARHDRRARRLTVTSLGVDILEAIVPKVLEAQEGFLQPLDDTERREFLRLTALLLSRTPASETDA